MVNLKYPFEVHPLAKEEGGGWLVTFPDLPGCMTDGETIEAALNNAEDAVKSWIETAKEFGDPIPATKKEFTGRFLQRLPRSLHEKLVKQAKSDGVSVNMLVTALIAEGLGSRKSK